jgi:hypothetical protein
MTATPKAFNKAPPMNTALRPVPIPSVTAAFSGREEDDGLFDG